VNFSSRVPSVTAARSIFSRLAIRGYFSVHSPSRDQPDQLWLPIACFRRKIVGAADEYPL